MTKLFFSIVLITACSLQVFAQDYRAMVRPKDSKEWGYINEKGKMVIQPQFRSCTPFSADGFAVIKEKRQAQFIDINGKSLPVPYKKFSLKEFIGTTLSFDNGLAPIREKKRYGFLNKKGKLAIPMKYDNVSGFRDGHAFAILNDNYYILHVDGKEFPIKMDEIVEIKRPSEGMVAFKNKDKKMGFVNAEGKIVIPAKHERVGRFSNGLAWARGANDKIGFIDKTGKWIIKPTYDAVKHFDPVSGIAKVKGADGWMYIKKDGSKLKLNIQTDVYGDFVDGIAKGRIDGKFGFFGPDGNWVIKPQFDNVGKVRAGFIPVRKEKLWGFVDMTGKIVIDYQFEGVRPMVKIEG